MKEIIIGEPPIKRYFICPKDKCVFMSDEYKLGYEKGQEKSFQDVCPSCNEFLWLEEIGYNKSQELKLKIT